MSAWHVVTILVSTCVGVFCGALAAHIFWAQRYETTRRALADTIRALSKSRNAPPPEKPSSVEDLLAYETNPAGDRPDDK